MNATSTPLRRDSHTVRRPDSSSPRLLRALLGFDASTCAVLGLALVTANGLAARLTGLPAGPLAEAGVVLIGFAVVIAWIAIRNASSRPAVLFVVDANLLWAAGSVAFAWFFMETGTSIGRLLVAAQGIAVGGLALIEFHALRRMAAKG